jgi:hypothetical protein
MPMLLVHNRRWARAYVPPLSGQTEPPCEAAWLRGAQAARGHARLPAVELWQQQAAVGRTAYSVYREWRNTFEQRLEMFSWGWHWNGSGLERCLSVEGRGEG